MAQRNASSSSFDPQVDQKWRVISLARKSLCEMSLQLSQLLDKAKKMQANPDFLAKYLKDRAADEEGRLSETDSTGSWILATDDELTPSEPS